MLWDRFPRGVILENGRPKPPVSKVQRNRLGLDMEKKAAGTAHDTVGQPGTQMPMMAKTTKIRPSERDDHFTGLDVMAYVAMTSSTVANLAVDSVMSPRQEP